MEKLVTKIRTELANNNIYADVYELGNDIGMYISWGDWKHEHLRAQRIIENLINCEISKEITEDDGSDCYSAEYRICIVG